MRNSPAGIAAAILSPEIIKVTVICFLNVTYQIKCTCFMSLYRKFRWNENTFAKTIVKKQFMNSETTEIDVFASK